MPNDLIAELYAAARALTDEPGVYLMHNAADEIIYVGKAKNLKNRVSSYFHALDRHLPKVLAMVQQVAYFKTIVVSSEFEALVLECSLIKLHTPKYNILLKDDKGYRYLRVDTGDYPRIREVKRKDDDGATYLGPYLSSWVVKNTADEANKAFGLPTCNRQFPRDFRRQRPCLNYHLKQCMGVCKGNISPEEYRQAVEQAVDYIKGGSVETVKLLERQMNEAAEALDFEKAARCRDRLRAIERFSDKQRLVYTHVTDRDVLAFVGAGEELSLSILKFRGQKLVDKLDFLFPQYSTVEELRSEFLGSYYGAETTEIPPVLVLDGELPDAEPMMEFLSQKAGRKVQILLPQRGDQLRLVELAQQNAAEQLSLRRKQRNGRELAALDGLGKLLGMPKPPARIESYDISNIGGDTIVGAMVVFQDGRPEKASYRKFSMPQMHTPDDYAAMDDMLTRRFTRYLEQAPEGGSFNLLPDLLLIDGGQGHVRIAKTVLERLGLSIPTFGMVKDDRHRTRAIAADGGEISIVSYKNVFAFVTNVQDETHRFAISFARKSHQKSGFALSLTEVKGLGEARAKALFSHFKTKKAILAATEDELAAVKGMSRPVAKALRAAIEAGEIS